MILQLRSQLTGHHLLYKLINIGLPQLSLECFSYILTSNLIYRCCLLVNNIFIVIVTFNMDKFVVKFRSATEAIPKAWVDAPLPQKQVKRPVGRPRKRARDECDVDSDHQAKRVCTVPVVPVSDCIDPVVSGPVVPVL